MLFTILLASCSKNKGPQDSDFFIGTYKGAISYTTSSENQADENGSVTVVKGDNDYNFVFSGNIPDIKNISFEEEDDEYYISVGNSATSYIRVSKSKLVILYVEDGKTWTANCTR